MTETVISYLLDNPIIALLMGLLLVSLLLTIVKKLFKVALVIAVILLIAGGGVLHFANEQVKKHGTELLQRGGEILEEGAKTVEQGIKERISDGLSGDTTVSDTAQDSIKPARKSRR